ncbi:hypothetical protein Pelo_4152 [Pelomyxa schiedti]|nr:hypothetical protein Pelo_4152 [Pelomyxa schiedti]
MVNLHQVTVGLLTNNYLPTNSENIIVLSLGKSGKGNRSLGKGTWAKIKYSGWLTTKPISPEDVTFLSPEVLCNTQEASVDCVSPSADVWSFGITASLLLDPLKRPYEHLRTNKKYLFTDYSVSPPCNNCLYPMAIGLDLIRGKITPFPSRPPPSSSPPQPLLWRLGHQMTTLCLDPNPATRSIHTIVRVWDYFLP